ncbi:MAG: hypothetical protein JO117_03030 [Verrucomicrobia bacterium]|nr:hypothetical protein [Verrucomicrobiota bacterium]
MPPGIPSIASEYFAGASGGCFLDLSARAKLRLRGADRLRFLNGQVTNDVRRASAEASLYACVLTAKGKLCADGFILAGPDFLQFDAEPELREALTARLERYLIADDVEIEDVTDSLGLLHLPGAPLAEWGVRGAERGEVQLAESHRFGKAGVDIFCAPAGVPALKQMLVADRGLRELAAAEIEAWRIAAGIPRWGAELDENTLLPEAGLEARAVDYNKGCYVGQEVISRLKSVGHVNRRLHRLRGAGPALPAAGALLYPWDNPADSAPKEIGRLTSVAPVPGSEECQTTCWCALGYVRRGHGAPGARLRVGAGDGAESQATVEPSDDV